MKKLISTYGGVCVTAWMLTLPAFADIIYPEQQMVEDIANTIPSVLAVAMVLIAVAVIMWVIRRRRK